MEERYRYTFYEKDYEIGVTIAQTLDGALAAKSWGCNYQPVHVYPGFAVLQNRAKPERFIGVRWSKTKAKY